MMYKKPSERASHGEGFTTEAITPRGHIKEVRNRYDEKRT